MMNLRLPSRHFFTGTAIYNFHTFCSKPHCRTCRVHGDVSGTQDNDIFSYGDGGVNIRIHVGFHEVRPGQILVGREYTHIIFAGNIHKAGKTCSHTYVYGIVALFEKFIYRDGPADNSITFYFYSLSLKKIYFLGNDGFWQTEFGDTVDKHTAGFMESFINCDIVTLDYKISCDSQSGRAGTNYSNFFPSQGSPGRQFTRTVFPLIVSTESLQIANCHRFTFTTDNT